MKGLIAAALLFVPWSLVVVGGTMLAKKIMRGKKDPPKERRKL